MMMMGCPSATRWLQVFVYSLFSVQFIQGSALLNSLNCFNDYSTHWKCEWKESAEAQKRLPMTLYAWNTIDSNRKPCVRSQENEGPELRMSCILYNSEFFIHMKNSFTFLPERDVHQKITIVPANNGFYECVTLMLFETCHCSHTLAALFIITLRVRTPPPRWIMSDKLKDGTVILSWKSPVPSTFHLTMLYQIAYRRQDWEGWKDSASINVTKELNVSLSPRLFVSGSTYIFRVRTLPHDGEQPKGSWSKWSKELTMKIPEGDAAAPRNLQCNYNGLTKMSCTWEVHKEVTLSVSYALYYTELPAGRKNICLPNKKARTKASVPYVIYNCTMDLTPEQVQRSFSIQVRPLEEEKTFIAHETVKPQPPKNLKIEEHSDSAYMLRWNSSQPNMIQVTHQLCYWKEGDPECPSFSLLNVSDNVSEYNILSSNLKELSKYVAKVRSRSDGVYRGPWSEWSQTITWETKKVADNQIIFIVTPICVLLLLVSLCIGYKLKRSQEMWEISLPNPSKSKLLSNYQLGFWQPGEFTYFTEEYSADDESPCICFPQSSQALKAWETEENAEEIALKANSTQLEACPVPPAKEDKAEDQHSIQDESDAGETHNSTGLPYNPPAEQTTKLQHKSPYLMFNHAHSMSDLIGTKIQNSEYFTLPRPKGESFGEPSKSAPGRPLSAQEPQGYVFGMGAQQSFHPQEIQVQKANKAQCNSCIAVSSPSDSHAPMDGPILVITPDGTGPLMLKQIGDYCFFPGLKGSQEKLEVKKAQPNGHEEQQIIQDVPPHAVKAFKVMQRGYFALPQS